jgi:hypothetical protein
VAPVPCTSDTFRVIREVIARSPVEIESSLLRFAYEDVWRSLVGGACSTALHDLCRSEDQISRRSRGLPEACTTSILPLALAQKAYLHVGPPSWAFHRARRGARRADAPVGEKGAKETSKRFDQSRNNTIPHLLITLSSTPPRLAAQTIGAETRRLAFPIRRSPEIGPSHTVLESSNVSIDTLKA